MHAVAPAGDSDAKNRGSSGSLDDIGAASLAQGFASGRDAEDALSRWACMRRSADTTQLGVSWRSPDCFDDVSSFAHMAATVFVAIAMAAPLPLVLPICAFALCMAHLADRHAALFHDVFQFQLELLDESVLFFLLLLPPVQFCSYCRLFVCWDSHATLLSKFNV